MLLEKCVLDVRIDSGCFSGSISAKEFPHKILWQKIVFEESYDQNTKVDILLASTVVPGIVVTKLLTMPPF